MIAAGWDLLPVPGDRITCGLRMDWFRKQRRHTFVSLGMDVRNLGDKGFCDVEIFACVVCGRDQKGKS